MLHCTLLPEESGAQIEQIEVLLVENEDHYDRHSSDRRYTHKQIQCTAKGND